MFIEGIKFIVVISMDCLLVVQSVFDKFATSHGRFLFLLVVRAALFESPTERQRQHRTTGMGES